MSFQFRDLSGNNECAFHRERKIAVRSEVTEPMKRSIFQKKILKGLLDGVIKESDVDILIDNEFKNSSLFASKEEARLKCGDMSQQIKRAYQSLLRKKSEIQGYTWNTAPVAKDVVIPTNNGDIVIENVRPDLVVTYGNTVTAVKIRAKKPVDADGKALKAGVEKTDKTLYVLMRYAKEYAEANGLPTGTKFCAGSAIWYLRKGSDKRSLSSKEKVGKKGGEVHFDKDLFVDDNLKVTNNIKVMNEPYTAGVPTETNTDLIMKTVMTKFADGLSREECSADQCKNCEYNQICHYTKAPTVIHTPEAPTDLSLVKLSKAQNEIKDFRSGYAVCNAGPGAGKTFIMTLNTCGLMLAGAKPEEILILVFARSAAEVAQERIQLYNNDIGTGEDISGLSIKTFNEFGNDILQTEYKRFGFTRPPRVISSIERSCIIAHMLNTHDRIPDQDYRNFTKNESKCKGPVAVASMFFQVMKDKNYSEFDYMKVKETKNLNPFVSEEGAKALAALYIEYDAHLKERNLIEYADQELLLLELLKQDPYYFDQFGYKHILVDEGQDTSPRQFDILKYLTNTPSFESVMIVGDDSQSIYRFRDADPESFMRFEERMGLKKGTVKQFYMMDNFRSTPEILDFANKIISLNYERVDKKVIANKKSGDKVKCYGFCSKPDEYDFIAKSIKEKIDSGEAKPEEIAFIAATAGELQGIASRLTDLGVPSVMLSPERLNENSRVQAGLALAKCIKNPGDTKDILTCLNAIFDGGLLDQPDKAVNKMVEDKQAAYAAIRRMPEAEQRKAFFEELELFDQDDEIFESFVDTLQSQPSLDLIYNYCSNFDLYGDGETKRRECNYPGVVVTTAHSSKGMEWKIVYNSLSGYDKSDIHDGAKTNSDSYRHNKDAEERRRLLFVSATRAKEQLIVTGQYVAFGGFKDRHYNIFLEEAFEAAGEKFDRDRAARELDAANKKRNEEKQKAKQAEQDRLAELLKEALQAKAEQDVKSA